MSTMPTTSHKLVPSQKTFRENGEAKATKLQGDFNGNFTLYIAYTEEAKQDKKTWRYCQAEGQKIPINGFPYYSKAIDKPEPSPQEVLERFVKIIKTWASLGNMMSHAVIYLNLNRGFRVNLYHKEANIPTKNTKNKQLMFFDKNGNTSQSAYHMLNAPILHSEEVSEEKLNAYYNRLRHDKVEEEQAQSIYRYFEHYFGTWQTVKSPLAVEPSTETPEELKPQASQDNRQQASQDNRQQASQYNDIKDKYNLPSLKAKSPSQASRQEAIRAIEEGKKQAQQKERFLQQLAETQTSLNEKLKMYKQAYPADKIDKDFLQDILNSYQSENKNL